MKYKNKKKFWKRFFYEKIKNQNIPCWLEAFEPINRFFKTRLSPITYYSLRWQTYSHYLNNRSTVDKICIFSKMLSSFLFLLDVDMADSNCWFFLFRIILIYFFAIPSFSLHDHYPQKNAVAKFGCETSNLLTTILSDLW